MRLASLAVLISSTWLSGQVRTANTPDFEPVDSGPRIDTLKQRLLSGDRNSLNEFWRDFGRAGTPLVEPVKGSSTKVVVTFLWRGGPGTYSVGLLAPRENVPRMPYFPLRRLHSTDVWYKSWQVRDDLRFGYRFVLNMKPGEEYRQQETIDPLDPDQLDVAFDEEQPTTRFSIAGMPRGQDPKWITKQAGIPNGRVERHRFKSAILTNERAIWVYTPPGYERAKSEYHLLVLFDGFAYQNWIPVPTILDNLIHAGQLAPMIAVFIGNAPGSRVKELQYNPQFVDFVAKEIMPWVYEQWKVTRDPQKTIIGGYSLGGAASAFIAMEHPELFGNVLSQSGSFQEGHKDRKWEWLASQYDAHPKLPIKFFMEAGRLEDVSVDGPALLAANRHLVSVLRNKEYSVTYEEVGGTHEPAHWRGEFAKGLTSLAK